MRKEMVALITIVVLAACLRVYFAVDLPLSGDEVGVGVFQASGQAYIQKIRNPESAGTMEIFKVPVPPDIVPISGIQAFMSYSRRYSVDDVIRSLREAGMHPPLYYIILHYVLKFFGNEALTLRVISIVMSLISLLLLYQLGKRLCNNTWGGLSGALFLALSPYGIMYGTMVRPYPLAMMLALGSTLQALTLKTEQAPAFENLRVLGYILSALAGLYTIYHFLFVVLFQLSFLLIENFRNRKALLKIGIIAVCIAIGYAPWLPLLFDQLGVVTSGTWYFNTPLDFVTLVRAWVGFNFAFFLDGHTPFWIKALIVAFPFALTFWGYLTCFMSKRLRGFALATFVGIVANLTADRILDSNTLAFPKLSFLMTPLALLFLTIGIAHVKLKHATVFRGLAVLCCCALLLPGSFYILRHKPNFDGPKYLETLRDTIPTVFTGERKELVIINTAQRRYLMPLVHLIHVPVDIKILDARELETEMTDMHLENYERITVINCEVSFEAYSFLSNEALRYIAAYFAQRGIVLSEEYFFHHSSMSVFEKF